MKRKEFETQLKNGFKIEAPDTIWEKIKDEPITVTVPEKRKTNAARYSVAVGLAACAAVALTAAAVQRNNINQPSVTQGDFTADSEGSQEQSETEAPITAESNQSSAPEAVPPETSPQPEHGINIAIFKVHFHRLYQLKDVYLTESDLDKEYTETVNGNEIDIFSVKGKSVDECFAWKANGGIHYYECIDDGIVEINGNSYRLLERSVFPFPEKGKFLGETENKKIYEAVGSSEKVLVDMQTVMEKTAPVVDSEQLYAAELIK